MTLLLNKKQKIACLILIISFILLLFFGIPSLARYKNRISTSINVWSGNIASSFSDGDGTQENPYIISNGEELAYLASQLKTTNYENTYFKLSNDIILNDGRFIYEEDIKYVIGDQTYYINEDKYYKSKDYKQEMVGKINLFEPLNGFKGNFIGDYYTIYGLYINKTNASLFTNLEGNIESLYIDNALILGTEKASVLADKAINSNINNILVDGIVINNNVNKVKEEISIIVEEQNIEEDTSISIDIPNLSHLYNKTLIKLKGKYNGNVNLTINNNQFKEGQFEIELNNNEEEIIVNIEKLSEEQVNVEFESVTLEVTHDHGIAAGIIGESISTTITNSINKADIYGKIISSGIIGQSNETTIKNTYNNAIIKSEYISGGIIGEIIKSEVIVDHVYNTGLLEGTNTGLISKIYDSNITLNNSFITTEDYLINELNNSTLISNNNYYVEKGINSESDNSTKTNIESLKSKNFLSNYQEFESTEDNPVDKVWVFEDSSFPLLYIDDIINSPAQLYVNTSMWDTYSPNLETNKTTGNITFMIKNVKEIETVEKYYYISNQKTGISKEELSNVEWNPYTDVVQIDEEGFYTIYAKLIDDNGVTSYINSDLFILDNSEAIIDIKLNNYHYSELRNDEVYINGTCLISISAEDTLSGISSIKYYLSDTYIENLEEITDWTDYENEITINEIGEKILYVKVIDNCDFIAYASTPLIVNDGYTVELSPLGQTETTNFTITDTSSIVYNIKYSNNKKLDIDTHNIISNIELPQQTKITLIDNLNYKVYEYIVDKNTNNCINKCIYPFQLFKEKGKITETYYEENSISNENYTIIIDFETTNIETSYNDILIYLEGIKEEKVVRPTLENSKKYFNIQKDNKLKHNIETSFNGEINYNSDSKTDIIINNNITLNGVYDTNYYNKKIGLLIEFIDEEENLVNKKYLKNLIFKIGDKAYSPDNDGRIRINLDTNISNQVNLTVTTYEGNQELEQGKYYLKISGFASYDGMYYEEKIEDYILIPVNVQKIITNRNDYTFDVSIDNPMIDLNNRENIEFNILYDNIENPNIKVSFYKKEKLTAYDQNYILVDLQNYTPDTLNKYIDNFYNINPNGIFTLNLDTKKFDKTGYKFVFDLYDGNNKIGSISKYIIVR